MITNSIEDRNIRDSCRLACRHTDKEKQGSVKTLTINDCIVSISYGADDTDNRIDTIKEILLSAYRTKALN